MWFQWKQIHQIQSNIVNYFEWHFWTLSEQFPLSFSSGFGIHQLLREIFCSWAAKCFTMFASWLLTLLFTAGSVANSAVLLQTLMGVNQNSKVAGQKTKTMSWLTTQANKYSNVLYKFNTGNPIFFQKAPKGFQATAPDPTNLRWFCRQSRGARCTVIDATHRQPPW